MITCMVIHLILSLTITHKHGLISAKLNGHRLLAALGPYDITMTYRCGKANGDADGLSRRPHVCAELFPDVIKTIFQAYTVKTDPCPYFKSLVSNAVNVELYD